MLSLRGKEARPQGRATIESLSYWVMPEKAGDAENLRIAIGHGNLPDAAE
jgi:hypothetical protein